MNQGDDASYVARMRAENNMDEVGGTLITYVDNNDRLVENNNATYTELGGGGYIISTDDADGHNGEFFVPNNRVISGTGMDPETELQEFILSTHNSRIVPLSEATNRAAVGGAKRKSKRNSKKKKRKSKRKKSKRKKSKKKRYRKKSKKR